MNKLLLTLMLIFAFFTNHGVAAEMTDEQREKLIDVFREFNERREKECPDIHVDFGYAMVALGDGILGKPLARVSGKEMRKSGYPQMSVAIDSLGDVFLYRTCEESRCLKAQLTVDCVPC